MKLPASWLSHVDPRALIPSAGAHPPVISQGRLMECAHPRGVCISKAEAPPPRVCSLLGSQLSHAACPIRHGRRRRWHIERRDPHPAARDRTLGAERLLLFRAQPPLGESTIGQPVRVTTSGCRLGALCWHRVLLNDARTATEALPASLTPPPIALCGDWPTALCGAIRGSLHCLVGLCRRSTVKGASWPQASSNGQRPWSGACL